MRSLALLVALAAATGCARTTPAPAAPSSSAPAAAAAPDARRCTRVDRTLGVGALGWGQVLRVPGACVRGGVGADTQLRTALVQALAATGCFAKVVDLEASGGTQPVDLVLTATVAQLEACAFTARTAASEHAAGAAFISAFTFGAPIGGAVGRAVANQARGGWAAAQLLDVRLRDGTRSLWRRGVVTVTVREAGQNDSAVTPEALLGRATTLVAEDLGRKVGRLSSGDSPYGLITLAPAGPEQKPRIAVLAGEDADEAQALATVPAPLRAQLGEGYPLAWAPDRFVGTSGAPTATAAVVGLFVTMEDATDWILTRNPRVSGLRVVPVK